MSEQKYLDLTAGKQVVYAKDISWKRGDNGAPEITIIFAEKPSSQDAAALTTNYKLRTSTPADTQYVRMLRDKELMAILLPLADIVPAEGERVKLSKVLQDAKANLEQADIKCEIEVEITEGKVITKGERAGEKAQFRNIKDLQALEAITKVPYDSPLEYDLDEIPF